MRETGLPIIVRIDGKRVVLIGTGEAADAKRRLLERAGAVVVTAADDARLAIVALDDDRAVEVAHSLKAQGKLVNVVDRPDLCDFTLPAIVDRSPVLVAVATGGASAGLAAALRQRMEAMLPERLGALATALSNARQEIRARFPDGRDRRNALAAALDEGGVLDPLRDSGVDAVQGWLAQSAVAAAPRLERIVLASPDPDELTLRQARLLARADRVFHRPGAPPAILDRARADAPRICCTAPPADPGAGLSIDLASAW